MSLPCEFCGENFPTNANLYIHKQTYHKPPKLLLMNHDHKENNDQFDSKDGLNNRKKKSKTTFDDSNSDIQDDFQIVDEYKFDKKRKRKRINNDSKFPKKRRDDEQDDKNLEIIDEYNDDGQDDSNLDVIDEYNEDGQDDNNLSVIDEYSDDGQDDKDLKIVDRYDHNKKRLNYKQLYENCLKSSRKLRERIKKILYTNNKRLRESKLTSQTVLQQQKVRFDQEIIALNENCNEKINAIKEKYKEKIRQLEYKHKTEYEKLEDECEEKIKILRSHIKSLEEDDESVNMLTKAVFSCTSMQEIFEIQRLVKNHQIDLVVQRHLKTLQNLFLSLSFGILPICQPQREKITDEHRKFIEKIQSVSQNRAKGVLKEKRHELTSLFTIIEDSLKLARNSYNKYGSI